MPDGALEANTRSCIEIHIRCWNSTKSSYRNMSTELEGAIADGVPGTTRFLCCLLGNADNQAHPFAGVRKRLILIDRETLKVLK